MLTMAGFVIGIVAAIAIAGVWCGAGMLFGFALPTELQFQGMLVLGASVLSLGGLVVDVVCG